MLLPYKNNDMQGPNSNHLKIYVAVVVSKALYTRKSIHISRRTCGSVHDELISLLFENRLLGQDNDATAPIMDVLT